MQPIAPTPAPAPAPVAAAVKPQPMHDIASITWASGTPKTPSFTLRSLELRYAGTNDARLAPSATAKVSIGGGREYDNTPNSALATVNASGESIRGAARAIQELMEAAGHQGLMPRDNQASYGPLEPGTMRAVLQYEAGVPGPAAVVLKIADAPEPLKQAFEAAQKLHTDLITQALTPKEAA